MWKALPGLFKRRGRSRRPRRVLRFAERLQRLAMRLALGLAALGLLSLCALAGWRLYGFLYRSDYFRLRELIVVGCDGELESRIRRDLRREGLDEGNLLRIDAERLRQVVEARPAVRRAHVRFHHPAQISVRVEPRRPVALLVSDPILAVDAEGVVVRAVSPRHEDAASHPFISGIDTDGVVMGAPIASESLTRSLFLLHCLQEHAPELYALVSEVHCDKEDNLTLLLKGGTRILFGTHDPVRRMAALETVLDTVGPPQSFAYIDLRFEGSVPWKPRSVAQAEGDADAETR